VTLGLKKAHRKCKNIIARDKKVSSPSLTREYDFVWEKAKNCYIWDADGNKYLDFAAGIAVANVGHTNSEVVKAVRKQASLSMHTGFSDFYTELPVKLTEKVLAFMPNSFQKAFLSNSGTESVEAAYKLARYHTNKKWVIAFKNAFHGRTMGSLSMTNSQPVQRERYEPFLPIKHVTFAYPYRSPYPDNEEKCADYYLKKVEQAAKEKKNKLAAIFLEPIQGEGGYIVPPKRFIQGLREIADKYNALLCADEVQSGCFRTGTFLAMQGFGVRADIVSLSKAVGGGIPLGVTVSTNEIMDWPPGSHANTFGGNLIACSAGIATLDYMKKNNLGNNARKIGNYIKNELMNLKEKYEIIGDVRGKGLMIGIEFVKTKKSKKYAVKERTKILKDSVNLGLIMLPAGISSIRISPPLTLTKTQATAGIDILETAIKKYSK